MFFTYNLACISGALEIASELDRNARLTVGEGREGGKGGREGIWTNGKPVEFRTVDQWVCVLVGLWHLFNQPFPFRPSRAHPVVAVAVLT